MQQRKLYDASADEVLQDFLAHVDIPVKTLIQDYLENKPGAETRLTNRFSENRYFACRDAKESTALSEQIKILTTDLNTAKPEENKKPNAFVTRQKAVLGLCFLWKNHVKLIASINREDFRTSCDYLLQAIEDNNNNSLSLFLAAHIVEKSVIYNSGFFSTHEASTRVIPEDIQDRGLYFAQQAAQYGSTAAQALLGDICLTDPQRLNLNLGVGTPEIADAAKEYLLPAAELNDTRSIELLTKLDANYENDDVAFSEYMKTNVTYLQQAAKVGHIRSMSELASRYSDEYINQNPDLSDPGRSAAYLRALAHWRSKSWREAAKDIPDATDLAAIYHMALLYFPDNTPTSKKVMLWQLIQENYAAFDQLSNSDDWAHIQQSFTANPDVPGEEELLPDRAQAEKIFKHKQHDLALKIHFLQPEYREWGVLDLILKESHIHPCYLVGIEEELAKITPEEIHAMDVKIATEKTTAPPAINTEAEVVCDQLKLLVKDNLDYLKDEIISQLKSDYFNSLEEANEFRIANLTRIYDTPKEKLSGLDQTIKNNFRIMEAFAKLRAVAELYGPVEIKADPVKKIEQFNKKLEEIEKTNILKFTAESKGETKPKSTQFFATSLAPNSINLIKQAREIIYTYMQTKKRRQRK